MGELGLRGAVRARVERTTFADPLAPRAADLVRRKFAPLAPKWDVKDVVHHTGRGSQYTSIAFTEWFAESGIQPSVGAVGSSYDNALAETINGLHKTEPIKPGGPWRSVDHVEFATAEWVDRFHHRRLYRYCGDIPPAEMATAYYAQQPVQQPAGLSHR